MSSLLSAFSVPRYAIWWVHWLALLLLLFPPTVFVVGTTLRNHNRVVLWLQNLRCAVEHCHLERLVQPGAIEVVSCAFSCQASATVALESFLYVARRSSSRTSATSFTLLSSVHVFLFRVFFYDHKLQKKKRLSQRKTITAIHCEHTTNFTQGSVGFLSRKITILMYNL